MVFFAIPSILDELQNTVQIMMYYKTYASLRDGWFEKKSRYVGREVPILI